MKSLTVVSNKDLIASRLSQINPSPKLSSLIEKLDLVTLGDLIHTLTEIVFEYQHELKECDEELQVKLGTLELTMKYVEELLEISHVFSIFQDGQIASRSNS